MKSLFEDFHSAWRNGDAEGAVRALKETRYADPFSREIISGARLKAHFAQVFAGFQVDLLEIGGPVEAGSQLVAPWKLRGRITGEVAPGINAQDAAVTLEGVDVVGQSDGMALLRRHFDLPTLWAAVGVRPELVRHDTAKRAYGYSYRDWASSQKPGALAMVWISARDEAEKQRVQQRAVSIISDFHKHPGFIGVVTGFTGLHGFAVSAWDNAESVKLATRGPGAHRDAMAAFDAGLTGGVFTSVWQPHHLNTLWVRCKTCNKPSDAVANNGECPHCGAALGAHEPYI